MSVGIRCGLAWVVWGAAIALCCFFFQAEDGIRDLYVTGVQTCALPIFAAGHDLRELGWYVAVTQQLGRWCAVGVRYDRYDPDADARQQVGAVQVPRDKSFSTLSVVVAAMVQPYGRLSFEWDHNTNALGVAVTGAGATLGGDVLTLRGQVVF